MYERYGALFGLRNQGGDEAVAAIIESLNAKSALLRHDVNVKYVFVNHDFATSLSSFSRLIYFLWFQVAYVLGQLQNKSASDALSRVLKDVNEHPMVRHEAAEALGSIAGLVINAL